MANSTQLSCPPHLLLLEAALGYASRGFRVIPVRAGTKVPHICKWPKLATKDASTIRRWWGAWPDASIGIVCGKGLFALDIDGDEGRRGQGDLESRYGSFPKTLTTISGRAEGGKHYLYSCPKSLRVPTRRHYMRDGIDIRGNGGFVVAPPSIHANGNTYVFADPSTPIAPAPDWLIDHIKAENRKNRHRRFSPRKINSVISEDAPITEVKVMMESDPTLPIIKTGSKTTALLVLPDDLRRSSTNVAYAVASISNKLITDYGPVLGIGRVYAGRDRVKAELQAMGHDYDRSTVAAGLRQLVKRDVLKVVGKGKTWIDEQEKKRLRVGLGKEEWPKKRGSFAYELLVWVDDLREHMRRAIERLNERLNDLVDNPKDHENRRKDLLRTLLEREDETVRRILLSLISSKLLSCLLWSIGFAFPGVRSDTARWLTKRCTKEGLRENEAKMVLRVYYAHIDDVTDFTFGEIEKTVRSYYRLHVV